MDNVKNLAISEALEQITNILVNLTHHAVHPTYRYSIDINLDALRRNVAKIAQLEEQERNARKARTR
jgi:hypothetical protein